MDPEPERLAQIFKLKRLKGRGLAPKKQLDEREGTRFKPAGADSPGS